MNISSENHVIAKENRRRNRRFTLPSPKHLIAMTAGGLLGAAVFHYVGYQVLEWIGVGIHIPVSTQKENNATRLPDKIILHQIAEPIKDVPEPVEAPPEIEQIEEQPVELPDLEDIPLEEVVMAPGETSFAPIPVSVNVPSDSLPKELPSLDMKAIVRGMPEPSSAEALKATNSSVKVIVPEPTSVNPDDWYNAKLKGAGGTDDTHLPNGSKSLGQLMAMTDLGKDSGYSRLGADLLFEFNKAVMKNSARLSMLQLANLMMKNPDTAFIIEGHTDSIGSADYNAVLSMMRANAVRLWLQKNGIPLTRGDGSCRLFIRACGASRPVVSITGSQEAQAANRRVEIHMRKRNEGLPVGCKGIDFPVDMLTPIAQQVQTGVGAMMKIPAQAAQMSPLNEKMASKPESQPSPTLTPAEKAPKDPNIPEAEPVAEPDEEVIPDATPLEVLPIVPMPDDVPLAEPIL